MATATTNEDTVGKYKDMGKGRELELLINQLTGETIVKIDRRLGVNQEVKIRFVFSRFTVSPQTVTLTLIAPMLHAYSGNTKTYAPMNVPTAASKFVKDIADNKLNDSYATKKFLSIMIAVLNGFKSKVSVADFDEIRSVLRVWAS